jgi:hypothetical protein
VTDSDRVLLDIYARADITQLCKGNAYTRLQWEDVTVSGGLCCPGGMAGNGGLDTAGWAGVAAGSRASFGGQGKA